jgi:hypothetical protein
MVIGFLLAGIFFYWSYLWSDFGYAFRQFYTNKAPAISYKSDITLSPGSIRIGKNQPVMIRVLDPDPRLEHRLYYRFTESWRELGLSQNSYVFNRLENSIEYYVENEVAKSPIYKISVLDEPIVREWQVRYQYPAYTGLSAFSDSLSYGDIEAYAGTVVSLGIRPISHSASYHGLEDPAVRAHQKSSAEFIAQFKINKATTWYLEMEMDLGRLSRPEEKQIRCCRISPSDQDCLPRPGYQPESDLMLPLIISADDDFGLANCSLHYQINSDPAHCITVQSVIRPSCITRIMCGYEGSRSLPGDVVTYGQRFTTTLPHLKRHPAASSAPASPPLRKSTLRSKQTKSRKQDELSSSLQESESCRNALRKSAGKC